MKEDSKEKLFRNIKSKIDFNRNILLFKAYLSSLYTHITNNNPHHFNLYTLYHLTQWPLFIAEKVYAYFIKASNQSKLTNSLFCDRMLSLYYSTLKELSEIVFEILDYDNDKVVTIDDVKIFFIHFHMVKRTSKEERSIYEIINYFFDSNYSMTKGDFIWKSNNVNSDIIMLFVMFLSENCFYYKEVIDYYEKEMYVSENKFYFEDKSNFGLYHLTKNFVEYSSDSLNESEFNDLSDDEEDLNELNKFECEIIEMKNEIDKNQIMIKCGNFSFFPHKMRQRKANTFGNNISDIFDNTDKTAMCSSYYTETNRSIKKLMVNYNSHMNSYTEFKFYIKEEENENSNANNNDWDEDTEYSQTAKFSKAKVTFVKNNMFIVIYPRYKNVNKSAYKSLIYLSHLTSYLQIEPVSFSSFAKIKFSIKIFYSFSNYSSVNIFYTDKESLMKLFKETFYKNVNTGYRNINDDYVIVDSIGKGKFGVVKLGKPKANLMQKVAIKFVDKASNNIYSVFEINQWEKYIFSFLSKISHPNIIHPISLYEDVNCIYYVYEYIQNGDLKQFIKKGNVKSANIMKITYQIVNGLYALHNYGILHRDLKPSNILITKDEIVKIIDFGLSKIMGVTDKTNRQCGSLTFKSPELLKGKMYSLKTDIWSLGITLFYLKNNKAPFIHSNKDKLKELIINSGDFPKEELETETKTGVKRTSSELISIFTINSIISNCLVHNPKKRFSINDIMKQYFTNFVC